MNYITFFFSSLQPTVMLMFLLEQGNFLCRFLFFFCTNGFIEPNKKYEKKVTGFKCLESCKYQVAGPINIDIFVMF